MSRFRIHALSLLPLTDKQQQRIKTFGELNYSVAVLHDPQEAEKCRGADVLIVTPRLHQDVVAALDHCRLISVQAIGTDSINVPLANKKGIVVCHVPSPFTAEAVAEHAFAFILSLAKRMEIGKNILHAGSWKTGIAYQTKSLAGATIGIVGFGRIGQRLSSIAQGFRMNVLASEKDQQKISRAARPIRFVDMDTLLRQSDFVTLAVPATKETERMIDYGALSKMKSTAFLINTARGTLVSEEDLIRALRESRIAGAGLDVFVQEPPSPEHPLLRMENVVVSPHVAGSTENALSFLIEQSIANVEAFLKGQPVNVVNPEILKTP